MTASLHVVDHVLLSHRLAELRDVATPSPRFRRLLAEIGAILTTCLLYTSPSPRDS